MVPILAMDCQVLSPSNGTRQGLNMAESDDVRSGDAQ